VLYRQDIATLALERFRFVDESGINLAMTRRYGRASRGLRVLDAVPKNHGKNVTVLGALSCQGIDAVMTVEGATGSAVFRAYVWQVLAPTLAPGDIVVMDNLGAHKVKGVRETTGDDGRMALCCAESSFLLGNTGSVQAHTSLDKATAVKRLH